MNWKNESMWTALIGAAVTILTGIGVATAEEGAGLAQYATQTVIGVLGLFQVVNGIISRRKAVADEKKGE